MGGDAADGGPADARASAMDDGPSMDDALGNDAGVPSASDSGCAGPGVFCEDFEEGQIDTSKWDVPPAMGGSVMIEQTNVAHGKYAVQFHSTASLARDYAYVITKNAPASLQIHNFGRAYFYVSPKPRSGDVGFIYGGTAGFPRPTYLSIASTGGGWQFGLIKLQGSPGGEVQAYPPGPVPVMAWVCLQWEFNDNPDEIHVWNNNVLIGSLTNQDIAYPPGHTPGSPLFNNMNSGIIGGFAAFGFGFYDWHPSAGFTFDVYYDDIVLDTKPVSCLP
jgi:hypothetical protein